MKERMDDDSTPGQFLITGSANILALATITTRSPAG
jgi:hypothetical protein